MVTIHLLRFLTVSHFIERTGLQKLDQIKEAIVFYKTLQSYRLIIYIQWIQASWNEFQRFKEIRTHTFKQ